MCIRATHDSLETQPASLAHASQKSDETGSIAHVSAAKPTRGRSAQDPPCPRAHVRSKKKKKEKNPEFDSRFRQNFPWEASPEALLEVISDENIGRTDKLSRSS